MTRVLSQYLYKAAKAAYCKGTKTLPILNHYNLYTRDGYLHIEAVDTSGETWTLAAEQTPARVENEIDTCIPMRPFRDWLSVTAKYKSVLEMTLDERTQIVTIRETPAADNGEPLAPSRAQFKCLDAREFPAHLPQRAQ